MSAFDAVTIFNKSCRLLLKLGIDYLHVFENGDMTRRRRWSGTKRSWIAFGVPFLTNSDLPECYRTGVLLNALIETRSYTATGGATPNT